MFGKLKFRIPEIYDFFGGYAMTSDEYVCHNEVTDYSKITGFGDAKDTSSFGYTSPIIMSNTNYNGCCREGVFQTGKKVTYSVDDFAIGVRPQIKYSLIKRNCKKLDTDINANVIDNRMQKKYFEVEFGEYPQKVLCDMCDKLEKLYENNKLYLTGKNYIAGIHDRRICYREYMYEGRKFIRADNNFEDKKNCWIEVLPVVWQVDPKKNIALSKYVLFAGVPYNNIYEYLDKYFSEDIIPSSQLLLNKSNIEHNSNVKALPTVNNTEIDKIINELSNMELDNVDTASLDSLINYGDELSTHTNYINEEYKKLIVNNLIETSLSNVETVVSEIRNMKPVNRKLTIIERLSRKKGTINQKEINLEILSRLNNSINTSLSDLNRELSGFDHIKRYHEIYIKRLNKYIELTKEAIKKETELANSIEDKNEKLNHLTNIEILKGKLNSFEVSLVTRTGELVQIHESILNHFMTINSLRTAREDLVPLIANELVIKIGNNTSKSSIELSECVINLFNSLLTRNNKDTIENLERLKHSNLPIETINKISSDLELYLNSGNNEAVNNNENNLLKKVKTSEPIIRYINDFKTADVIDKSLIIKK